MGERGTKISELIGGEGKSKESAKFGHSLLERVGARQVPSIAVCFCTWCILESLLLIEASLKIPNFRRKISILLFIKNSVPSPNGRSTYAYPTPISYSHASSRAPETSTLHPDLIILVPFPKNSRTPKTSLPFQISCHIIST